MALAKATPTAAGAGLLVGVLPFQRGQLNELRDPLLAIDSK
jgi:hypothetical protein